MFNQLVAVWLVLLPFAQCIQIHKHMTQEEVLKTFQTGHDTVPEYEVVRLYHTLHKRDTEDKNVTRMVKVNAIGREISLYLHPNEGLLAGVSTPLWTVIPDGGWPERTKYTRRTDILANIGKAYQDVSKMAAIVAYEGEDGETLLHGNLQDDIIVRPLPHHLHETILREERSLDDSLPSGIDAAEDFRRSHHHVVFRRSERDVKPIPGDIRVVKRKRRNTGNSTGERRKRSIPEIIYPELLLIVDYSLHSVIGKNVEDTARYLLAFWNAVDLRYRVLEEPIIRLNIAGIIISLKSGGTPYLENYKRGLTDVDADLALVAMSRYFYRESYRFRFTTYDMAVAMTHLDMCNIGMNGICDRSTLGYAYEWGACNRSHVDMNTEAVGIVEDNGGYSAIIPAAHEVAHLMGAPHDGLQDTLSCPGYHGYLMSSGLNMSPNSFLWSNCSLQNFYDFFDSPDASCVHNKPRNDEALVRLLPGKLMSLDEQCEKVFGARACHYDDKVCTALKCHVPGMGDEFCRAVSAAAEGSSCGDGMHCINGHCVSENSTFVPYTLSTTMKPFKPNLRRPGFIFPPRNVTNGVDPEKNTEKKDDSTTETNDR